MLLGLLGDVPRIAGVGLAGQRVAHEAVEDQRLVPHERVDDSRVRIGHQDHVRFLDLLEATDRRAVEAVALLEGVRRQLVRGNREVLHQPRQIAETEVDDLHAFAGDEIKDLVRIPFSHIAS